MFSLQLEFPFKVICSCQTWITGYSNVNTDLRDYIVITLNCQKKCKGGGVCISVHDSVSFQIRGDLDISDENNEILNGEIKKKQLKHHIQFCI